MAYGFNSDKSTYDLGNMGRETVGTFTKSSIGAGSITLDGMRCVVRGMMGVLTGRMTISADDGSWWWRIGTIAGVAIAKRAYSMSKAFYGNDDGWQVPIVVRVDTDGGVYIWINNSVHNLAPFDISVPFMVL